MPRRDAGGGISGGGGTHTGKTLAAQRALEKYSNPYLSIDHLKMGLIRSGICPLAPESPDEELTPFLWSVIREIVKTAMENGQNLVVEGCCIPFDWKKDFTPACREQIRYVCLIFSEDYIQRHYHDIMDHANAIEQRMDEASCTRESLLRENRDNLEKCRQHGCDYLLIEESYNVDIVL